MSTPNFDLDNIIITTNENGELVLAGVYEGIQLDQVLTISNPCVIMFDVQNKNFYAISIDRHNSDDQFVTTL